MLRVKTKNQYYILRHGESEKNVPIALVSSWPELKSYHLTKTGRQQTRQAAQWLKKQNIDLIFSSDLTRTKDTAAIVSEALGVPVEFDERLREVDFGVYNGKTIEEYHAFFNDHSKNPNERFTKAPPDGENWQQVLDRVLNFIQSCEEKYSGQHILIISHGDPLWLLEWGVKGLPVSKLDIAHYNETGEPEELGVSYLPSSGTHSKAGKN